MKSIEKDFKKYGRSVYLTDGDWTSPVFNAFIQPLRYKNKMYMSGNFTEVGHYDEGYYLYIGPPSHNLKQLSIETVVHTSDMSCKVHRCEVVYIGNEPLYIWAVIKQKV